MKVKDLSIAENLSAIRKNIEAAQEKSPHNMGDVKLVVVSKHHNTDEIREAMAAGITEFGENRVQELLPKVEELAEEPLTFQLIGHLQTNKVRQIVDKVDMIQSLDSAKLAKEIEKRAAKIDRIIDVLVQVNMAGEEQKYGMAPDEVLPFLEDIRNYPHLHVQGLMFIAPNFEDKDDVRPYFAKMRELFFTIKEKNIPNVEMKWLSMGMSGDYMTAIEEGANMVRIGSAVFKTT